jgi:hypothetical protein
VSKLVKKFGQTVLCFPQNEALNGGGTLFVNKLPDLRVRVVHGNTLTAAVILNDIPEGTAEVFLTGATSKLGRAIALYLCKKQIRVMVRPNRSDRIGIHACK